MKKNGKIKVRIAPSPTGLFHIGTARTALFNYLFAKQNKGEFVLRIEDTDLERSNKKYEKDIIDGLEWLRLKWNEGPIRQTDRTKIYQKHIKKLLDSGNAFWCYHSKVELEEERNEQAKKKEAPRHICSHRHSGAKPKNLEEKGIIRFHCPDKKIKFTDLIRGELEFEVGLMGDISIARDEKTPLYNLAVVIDDCEMEISHVIRGEDHISNTPKQILLAEALGLDLPQYAHLPLILGEDKSKLSKRHGAVSVSQYRQEGYLPEAMNNFMALLGWNSGSTKEIYSIKELIREFSLERIQKSGAVFDIKKLDWINGQYIRNMDLDKLVELCIPYLAQSELIIPLWGQKDIIKGWYKFPFGITDCQVVATKQTINFEYVKKIIALEQERLKKISEIGELTDFFFKDKLDYDADLLIWKQMDKKEVKKNLELLHKELSKIDDFDKEILEKTIMPLTEKHGTGELLWPLRVALSGKKASPCPFEIADVLGKKETLKRVERAIEFLSYLS